MRRVKCHCDLLFCLPVSFFLNGLLSSQKSQSAFSLLTDEILAQHDKAEQSSMLCTQGLKKDEVPAIASWNQNTDWMDNSCKFF